MKDFSTICISPINHKSCLPQNFYNIYVHIPLVNVGEGGYVGVIGWDVSWAHTTNICTSCKNIHKTTNYTAMYLQIKK